MDAGWSRGVGVECAKYWVGTDTTFAALQASSLRQQRPLCTATITVLVEGWPELEGLLAS